MQRRERKGRILGWIARGCVEISGGAVPIHCETKRGMITTHQSAKTGEASTIASTDWDKLQHLLNKSRLLGLDTFVTAAPTVIDLSIEDLFPIDCMGGTSRLAPARGKRCCRSSADRPRRRILLLRQLPSLASGGRRSMIRRPGHTG
jgi:hypothetical protein